MGLFSKAFKSIRKLSNFLGLGIPDKIDSWLQPDVDTQQDLRIGREGSSLAVPVVYGEQKVGSIKIHKFVTNASGGLDNEFLHLICVFCEGEIEEIGEIFFNDVSENDNRWRKNDTEKYFTVVRRNGSESQAAIPEAVSQITNWTSQHRLQGLAYIYLRLELSKKKSIWRGEPNVSAIIKGKKILDTRTNVTAFSQNPAMCLRDYLSNSIYGKGLDAERFDDELFNAAANTCDTQTSVTSTITTSRYIQPDPDDIEPGINPPGFVINEPVTETVNINRFSCNLIVNTDRSIFNNVRELLGTFRGILPPAYMTGPVVEDAGSPVFDFNHTNIIGSISVDGGTVNDRKNRVIVRFPNALSMYEYDEAFYPADDDPIRTTWLEEDTGTNLEIEYTFNGITSKAEALQAAEIIAKRSRFTITASITVMPIAIRFEVGDLVSITDETHGWVAKPFRIVRRILSEDGLVDLAMDEHEDSVYPWSGRSYDDRQGGTFLGDPDFVEPVTNLSITSDTTFSTTGTLTWDGPLNQFVNRFNVLFERISQPDGTVIDPPTRVIELNVTDESYIVPLLDSGTYTVSVEAVTSLDARSEPATLSLALVAPSAPTSLTVNPTNFEIEVIPVLAGIGLGTQFEFALANTDNVLARGASVRFVGLIPDTEYTVFARTVNAFGISAWVSATTTTTSDAQPIIDLIGGDIAGEILPDVLAELQDDLQVIVDASLNGYSTTTEVTNLITNSIDQVNESAGEDIRIGIVEGVVDVFVDGEAERSIITETFNRQLQVNELTSTVGGNTSMITQVNQTLADETSARTTQINQLTATVNTNQSTNEAQFVTVNQAIADETSARTTSLNQLSATVNGNTASITTNQQAISDEAGARASAVSTLQASDTAILNQVGSVRSTANGNSSAISALSGTVNNPTSGLSATFTIASNAQTTASNAATSATSITNTVNNPANGLSATFTIASGARTTANGNLQSIGGLRSSIAGTNSQSQAELILESTFAPDLGQAFSRAFLGVSSTNNGVSSITGVLADGATNALDFRADVFRLTDTSGNVRLSYSTSQNRWVFNGALEAVTGTFAGALSGATGSFSGAINAGTGSVINGAFISNLSVDTIKIADQAVTVPTSVEFGDITVSGTADRSFPSVSIGTYVGGGVLFNFALNGTRTTSSSGNDEFLNLLVRIRSGTTVIKTFNYNMGLPNRNLPNTTTCAGVFSEAVLSGRIGQNLNLLVTADPQGVGDDDRTTLGGTGYVQYAKK